MSPLHFKFWLCLAGLSGALAVGFGAAGSHALKGQLSAEGLEQFHIAVRYHFLHTLALAATGFLLALSPGMQNWAAQAAAVAFLLGLLLFSGVLYLLAFGGIAALVRLVPIGGLFFILGWLLFALAALRLK